MLGGVALLAAGRCNGALADKNLNHGDKASFESSCKQHGGEFIDSPKDKLTQCIWGDGGRTVCDQDGNDCDNYPPPKPTKNVGGAEDPFGGFGGVVTTDIIETVETTPAADVTPVLAEETAALETSAKKRRRRGKRRKT
jgi:hypothetical protein